jgi:hypothetical protein
MGEEPIPKGTGQPFSPDLRGTERALSVACLVSGNLPHRLTSTVFAGTPGEAHRPEQGACGRLSDELFPSQAACHSLPAALS